MQRTVRVKLQPTDLQADSLLATTWLFTKAFNVVCQVGWDAQEKNGVHLHHLTYKRLKSEIPFLVSDLHIQARVKATEAVKSALALLKNGRKVSCPHAHFCPPRYNVHTFKVNWATCTATLSTVEGRITVPFVLPDYFKTMLDGKVCAADLVRKHSGWWLHVVVDLPAPHVRKNKQVIGVDLGLNRPAVTSNHKFLGDRRWKAVEARIRRQRRQCQQKGTQSARRRLRRVSGRQARFRWDCDHVLSRQIVNAVKPGGTIVLENLTGIRSRAKCRKRQRRRLHSWSFAQLKLFVAYKAEAAGCRVVLIDPRHTSQTCSQCGHQHRANRKSQSLFHCRLCGYRLNADLNAALNVRAKHLGTFGTPLRARPSSTGPTGASASNAGEALLLPASRLL